MQRRNTNPLRLFPLILLCAQLATTPRPTSAACTEAAPANPCTPGGGGKRTDCRVEWLVTPRPASDGSGIPKNTAVCYEGDPGCDLDLDLTNHSCTMRVALCVNNTDPRLSRCAPSYIDTFQVLSPRTSSADPADAANRAALESQLLGFGTSLVRGSRIVSRGVRNSTLNACGDSMSMVVPQLRLRSGTFQGGSKTLTVQANSSSSGLDRDSLVLQCHISTCGNGIVEAYESCDDGNRVAGDGCDPGCHSELAAGRSMLTLQVANDTGRSMTAEFSGTRVSGPADGNAVAYGPITQPVPAGTTEIALDVSLAPGMWVHHLSVASTGQAQHHQSLLVADPASANVVEWRLVQNVLVVNRGDDSGDGVCDATCTLRDAIEAAPGLAPPVLIRFDHGAFSRGVARIEVTSNAALAVRAAGTVIDGTDALGNASPITPFTDRVYPTIVTLHAPNASPQASDCPCQESPGGALRVQAERVELRGLAIHRQLAPEGQVCCGDQDLTAFDAGSNRSRIDTCRLDGGAAAITDAEVPSGQTRPATGKDCVDADSTGATSAEPVRIDNSERRFCYDRGVKSKRGVVRLQANWIHHNLRGGTRAAPIVTPTAVAVQSPLTCATPVMLRVRRRIAAGATVTSAPVPFCHN